MKLPVITIKLDGHHRIYRPGEMLTGSYGCELDDPRAISSIEISVIWRTEGKGDEDLGVHFFDSQTLEPDETTLPSALFATQLPNSPLSYDGAIVKIRWCVRVRAFLRDGDEALAERPFQLGNIPSVRRRHRPAVDSFVDETASPVAPGNAEIAGPSVDGTSPASDADRTRRPAPAALPSSSGPGAPAEPPPLGLSTRSRA